MVVSESIPGIEVEVIVGGVALKEHQDHDLEEEDRTVTRFIEATPGEIFTVRINVLPNVRFESDHIACNIYADGTWVESPLLAARDIGSPVVRGYRWLVDGRAQKCRFADLEIGKSACMIHFYPLADIHLKLATAISDRARLAKQRSSAQ